MPTYTVGGQRVVEFGTYDGGDLFMCEAGKKCTSAQPGFNDAGKLVAEGKVTVTTYNAPSKPAGTLAVYRNYENAIQALGGRKLNYVPGHEGIHVFLVDKDGARTWIVLADYYNNNYRLTTIEEKAMQQVVTAGQLASAIQQNGFATLHVNFDLDKSVIKPDAKPALDEIVKLLQADPSLRLSIEGHTDNIGNAAANKALSEARAKSVVAALTAGGIAAQRLQAKGFGSEVPVADNRTEAGRGANRRVELVKVR